MIMTLIVIMDKNKTYWGAEHSGHHHLRILQKIMPRFRYHMFGPATKKADEKITAKQLMKEIDSVSNGGCCFEEMKDLRSLKDFSYTGYILIGLGIDGLGCTYNELSTNIGSAELETQEMEDVMIKDFKLRYKSLKKEIQNSQEDKK